MIEAVRTYSSDVGTAPVCRALDVARSTLYRRCREDNAPYRERKPRPTPARALKPQEREQVLEVLHSERFMDKAPGEVVATLMDEGVYYCSERTMYPDSGRK